MTHAAALAARRNQSLNQATHVVRSVVAKIGTQFSLIMIGLAVVGSLSYLIIINRVATSGFEIKALEQKVETLKQTNRKLQLEATELQSLTKVESSAQALGLTEVAQVEYLPTTGGAVARK